MKYRIVIIAITMLAFLFTSCGEKEDSDNVGYNEISFSVFEFNIPDYYDVEPVTQTGDTAIYMRPKQKDMCQLMFIKVPFDGVYSRSNKTSLLQAQLDSLGLENVETWGGDDIQFTGEKDGVKMAGKLDSVYVSANDTVVSVDQSQVVVVTVLYKEDKQSPYYYGDDIIETIYKASIDGYEGAFALTTNDINDAYNSGDDSNDDDGDTDNNGTGDWHDVDTNNDGDVSQDEMNDYLDDWEKEMNDY